MLHQHNSTKLTARLQSIKEAGAKSKWVAPAKQRKHHSFEQEQTNLTRKMSLKRRKREGRNKSCLS